MNGYAQVDEIYDGMNHDVDQSPVLVPVNIKTGSCGRGGNAYLPIEDLHNQTRHVDVDMTWRQAIRTVFNFTEELDATRYFIRQHEPSSTMHSLNTPISDLLAEFKTEPEGDWRVTIIDVRQIKHASNSTKAIHAINKMLKQEEARKRGLHVESSSPSPSPPVKKRKIEQPHPSPKFDPSPVKSATRYYKDRSCPKEKSYTPHRKIQDLLPTPSQLEELQVHHREKRILAKKPVYTNLANDDADDEEEDDNNDEETSDVVKRETPILDDDDVYDDDNDDACSMLSQDSQEDELIRLGIPEQDFKSVFLQRISKNLTGEMLLKAQTALKEQKATSSENSTSRDRWTRWSLTCPYPISILRTLFDV